MSEYPCVGIWIACTYIWQDAPDEHVVCFGWLVGRSQSLETRGCSILHDVSLTGRSFPGAA